MTCICDSRFISFRVTRFPRTKTKQRSALFNDSLNTFNYVYIADKKRFKKQMLRGADRFVTVTLE